MILYFTGTGNSAFIAKRLGESLGDEVISINDRIRNKVKKPITGERLIFVTPTYAWRIPRLVEEWIVKTRFPEQTPAYFVMDCGGDIGAAERYNRRLCAKKHFRYMGTEAIMMPENYIALFAAPDLDTARQIVKGRMEQIRELARRIGDQKPLALVKTNLLGWINSVVVNPIFYLFVVKAKPFWTKDSCTGCGTCVQVCPLHNISLKDGRPVWGKRCTHCMACICKCPAEAIEYGKKSAGKPRYQCPSDEEGH